MKNLFLSFLALFSLSALGSHYLGGNISWTKTSSGQFIFELRVYKECGTGAASYIDTTLNGPQGVIPMTIDTVIEYTPECTGGRITCGVSPSGKGAVQLYVLRSSPQTLTGTPPANGWNFYWRDSAWPSLVNSNTGNVYFESSMYDLNTSGSPVFIEKFPEPLTTYNNTMNVSAQRGNPDDSLYYRFVSPKEGPTVLAYFSSGYNLNSPFPSSITNTSNGPVVMDEKTGLITYDINAANDGLYMFAVAVEQWKNGVLISRVMKSGAASYSSYTGGNSAPGAAIDTSIYADIVKTGPYSYEVTKAIGDTLDFSISATDIDINTSTSTSQVITFEASGSALPSPWGFGSGLYNVLPVISAVSPQSGFSSINSNTVNFRWPISTEHFIPNSSTHSFTFTFKDDHCPFPGLTSITLQVKVVKPVEVAKDTVRVCLGDSVQLSGNTATGNYSWQPTAGLSDPGIASPMASPSASGYYFLSDGIGAAKDSVFVEVTTPSAFDLNWTGGNLVLTDGNATNYRTWNYNGIPFYHQSDTLVPLGLGDYFVTANVGACQLITDTIGVWSGNSFSVVDPSNGGHKGRYQILSGSRGCTFLFDQSVNLTSVSIIGVEDLYKSSAGYDVNLKIFDENQVEVFDKNVSLNPPFSGVLNINVGYTLNAHKNYTIVISGGNSLTFRVIEDVQYPYAPYNSGLTIFGSYEGAAKQFPTQPSSYLLPITLNTDVKVVGLGESMESKISVYPNPANDVITITGFDSEGLVQLLDIQGKLLGSYEVDKSLLKINRGSLKSGLYLLNVSTNGKTEVRKVIFK